MSTEKCYRCGIAASTGYRAIPDGTNKPMCDRCVAKMDDEMTPRTTEGWKEWRVNRDPSIWEDG